MVKIPSLDDLKKAGASLMDSSHGSLSNRLKASVETLGENLAKDANDGTVSAVTSNDPVIRQFQQVESTLMEVTQMQAAQNKLIAQAMQQLATLHATVAAESAHKPGENK